MSKKSWKAEFYPVPANKVPVEEALDHSILKWTGLLPENLEKHGLNLGDEPVPLNDKTCALCRHFEKHDCLECPLYIVRGHVRCCDCTRHEKVGLHPYGAYCGEGALADARPMLAWLHYAKALQPRRRRRKAAPV